MFCFLFQTQTRFGIEHTDALMPDCGVHYLWFAFVCLLIRSHPPRLLRFVGLDFNGNKYFTLQRGDRIVEYRKDMLPVEVPHSIPIAWQLWLENKNIPHPPHPEEMVKAEEVLCSIPPFGICLKGRGGCGGDSRAAAGRRLQGTCERQGGP